MVSPDLMGYRYLSKFRPAPSCPLTPGMIDVSDTDLILNMILKLPLEGYQWKLQGMFMGKSVKGGKLHEIGCIMVYFEVLKEKKKANPKDPFELFL